MFQIIGGLGVGLLIAVLLVAWRLASGPVSISFLTPYIQTALSEVHKDAIKLDVEDTILTWAGWERTLDIRIVNLQTALPNGQVIATVPEVSLSLSAQALMKGNVAPRSIEFFGPTFHVERKTDGTFALGFEQDRELWIGQVAGYCNYWIGYIDDVIVYNRALTDPEIQALYHEGGWRE